MNASEIRATIDQIHRGNLSAAQAALRTTGKRTESARQAVRAALAGRVVQCEQLAKHRRAREDDETIFRDYLQALRFRALARLQRRHYRTICAVRVAFDGCGYRETTHGHTSEISVGTHPDASGRTSDMWPNQLDLPDSYCRGTVTVSTHSITVRKNWRSLQRLGLGVVDDLFTLEAARVRTGVYRARWVEQSRGSSLRVQTGFLVRANKRSPWVHCTTEKQIARAARDSAIRSSEAREILDTPADLDVTWSDAKAAGLCVSGCRDWLRKRGLPSNTPSVKARQLLALARRSGDRVALVERAIAAALAAKRVAA